MATGVKLTLAWADFEELAALTALMETAELGTGAGAV
jgi:hypothetical protein